MGLNLLALLTKSFVQVCRNFAIILGGAGGKGTWGKPGEVYDDVDMMNDEQDPNYDSEEAEVTTLITLFVH